VQRVEEMGRKVVGDLQEWLRNMLALAQKNSTLEPEMASFSFRDESLSMFYVRATSHAHPMVRDQVKETMHEWAKIRQELNGVTRGGRTGNQAWKTLEEVLQQTLDDVIKMDRMLITIQFSISEGTWRELFFGAQNGSTAVTGDFPTKGAPRNC